MGILDFYWGGAFGAKADTAARKREDEERSRIQKETEVRRQNAYKNLVVTPQKALQPVKVEQPKPTTPSKAATNLLGAQAAVQPKGGVPKVELDQGVTIGSQMREVPTTIGGVIGGFGKGILRTAASSIPGVGPILSRLPIRQTAQTAMDTGRYAFERALPAAFTYVGGKIGEGLSAPFMDPKQHAQAVELTRQEVQTQLTPTFVKDTKGVYKLQDVENPYLQSAARTAEAMQGKVPPALNYASQVGLGATFVIAPQVVAAGATVYTRALLGPTPTKVGTTTLRQPQSGAPQIAEPKIIDVTKNGKVVASAVAKAQQTQRYVRFTLSNEPNAYYRVSQQADKAVVIDKYVMGKSAWQKFANVFNPKGASANDPHLLIGEPVGTAAPSAKDVVAQQPGSEKFVQSLNYSPSPNHVLVQNYVDDALRDTSAQLTSKSSPAYIADPKLQAETLKALAGLKKNTYRTVGELVDDVNRVLPETMSTAARQQLIRQAAPSATSLVDDASTASFMAQRMFVEKANTPLVSALGPDDLKNLAPLGDKSPYMQGMLDGARSNPDAFSAIRDPGGKAIGLLNFEVSGKGAYVANIYVDPSARGHGVATEAIHSIFMKNPQVQGVVGDTLNTPADIAFWQGMGAQFKTQPSTNIFSTTRFTLDKNAFIERVFDQGMIEPALPTIGVIKANLAAGLTPKTIGAIVGSNQVTPLIENIAKAIENPEPVVTQGSIVETNARIFEAQKNLNVTDGATEDTILGNYLEQSLPLLEQGDTAAVQALSEDFGVLTGITPKLEIAEPKAPAKVDIVQPAAPQASPSTPATTAAPQATDGLTLAPQAQAGIPIPEVKKAVQEAIAGKPEALDKLSGGRVPDTGLMYVKLTKAEAAQVNPEYLSEGRSANRFPLFKDYEGNVSTQLATKLQARFEEARTAAKSGNFDVVQTKKGYNVVFANGVTSELKVNATPESKVKPVFGKPAFKTLLKNNDEFMANPKLTVTEKNIDGKTVKQLTFKGKKSTFSINAEAIGLKAENLKVGDVITVDTKAMLGTGKAQTPGIRVTKGGSTYASKDLFIEGQAVELGGRDVVYPLEMPELVDLAKQLTGATPKISKASSMPKAYGYFRPIGDGKIQLRADLFANNGAQAVRTLAHEIGHLVDWLPDKTMARGNVLGRVAVLRKFMADSLEGIEATNTTLRKELVAVTKYWKPFDEASVPASYRKYRLSAKELYADALSMLLNSPGTLEKMAPTFYKEFFAQLDKKPAVAEAYHDLQDLMAGDRMDVIKKRRLATQEMFGKAEQRAQDVAEAKQKAIDDRKKSFLRNFQHQMISKNSEMIRKIDQLKKKGIFISPDDDPRYAYEERNYIGGKIKAMLDVELSNQIMRPLNEAGIAWEVFGEKMLNDRIIAGDRAELANPLGKTPASAAEENADLMASLTKEQQGVLQKALNDYRSLQTKVLTDAYKPEGRRELSIMTDEQWQMVNENKYYAPFRVTDYLHRDLDAKFHAQVGTFKDVANPATQGVIKMISIIKAVERNKFAWKTQNLLATQFPDEFIEAPSVFTGKTRVFQKSKDQPELKLFYYKTAGEQKAILVDEYIADSVSFSSVRDNNMILSALHSANAKFFKPIFITFSAPFQIKNVVRDFTRSWKNIPNYSFYTALKRTFQAMPAARARAFGLWNKDGTLKKGADRIIAMERAGVLSVTFNSLARGGSVEDKQIEQMLKEYDLISQTPHNPLVRTLLKIGHTIQGVGDFSETLQKVSGWIELYEKRGMSAREAGSFIRKKVGSPDFLEGGTWTPATNDIYIFSNPMVQALTADYQVAIKDPVTRSGFWWKTAKRTFLPKLLMFAAAAGFFGKKIKDQMDKVSEYDKTNYSVIPVATIGNKVGYFRIPDDQTGQLIGGLFWKTLNVGQNKQSIWKDVTDIANYSGTIIPSPTPVFDAISSTGQMVTGRNPYDFFRQRSVLTDDQYRAGGAEAWGAFLKWQFNQIGGSAMMTFDTGTAPPREQTPGEKVLALPIVGPTMSSFFRISDYGQLEQYQKEIKQIQSSESKARIEENAKVNDAITEWQESKKTAADAARIETKLVEDVLGRKPTGEDKTEANQIIKKFVVGIAKGTNDPKISALIQATTKEQQRALLSTYQKGMSAKEFAAFLTEMIGFKVISKDIYK